MPKSPITNNVRKDYKTSGGLSRGVLEAVFFKGDGVMKLRDGDWVLDNRGNLYYVLHVEEPDKDLTMVEIKCPKSLDEKMVFSNQVRRASMSEISQYIEKQG